MKLKGKVAVITGATGGIGSELVKALDREGVTCILIGRNEEKLKLLSKSLNSRTKKYYVGDFTNDIQIAELAKKIAKDFSRIDLLVNLAGIGIYKLFENVTFKDWQDSMNIGVTAAYFLTKQLLPNLQKSDLSLVFNVGSGAGIYGMPVRSVYSATKFAFRGMTLSLAEEFRGFKPDFCLITLGSVLTEFGPMTLEEKFIQMQAGKAYFTPEWVVEKFVEIIKDPKREVEYTLFPSNYFGGKWNPPRIIEV